MKILENRLLVGIIGALVLYWGPGQFLPGSFVSMVASIGLLIFGGMAFAQYFHPAYQIVFQGRRDVSEEGSHYWVLGTFIVSAGIIYSGAWGVMWIAMHQPPQWSGTLVSSFGRALIAAGMAMQWWAPKAGTAGIQIKTGLWIWVAIILAFIGGMVFNSKFELPETTFRLSEDNRPLCPADHPVWGSSNRRYHLVNSPYRAQVQPVRCFKDAAEAELAGYIEAKWR